MSLVYALHSEGLATCTMNADITVEDEVKIRNLFGDGHYPE